MASATQGLHSNQEATAELERILAEHKQELSSLQQSVHALHAEQDRAQHAHAAVQTQVGQAQEELEDVLLRINSHRQWHEEGSGSEPANLPQSELAIEADKHPEEVEGVADDSRHGVSNQHTGVSKGRAAAGPQNSHQASFLSYHLTADQTWSLSLCTWTSHLLPSVILLLFSSSSLPIFCFENRQPLACAAG